MVTAAQVPVNLSKNQTIRHWIVRPKIGLRAFLREIFIRKRSSGSSATATLFHALETDCLDQCEFCFTVVAKLVRSLDELIAADGCCIYYVQLNGLFGRN